jgi:hypothetical protein
MGEEIALLRRPDASNPSVASALVRPRVRCPPDRIRTCGLCLRREIWVCSEASSGLRQRHIKPRRSPPCKRPSSRFRPVSHRGSIAPSPPTTRANDLDLEPRLRLPMLVTESQAAPLKRWRPRQFGD